jgi:hypothetical protein
VKPIELSGRKERENPKEKINDFFKKIVLTEISETYIEA